MKIIDCNCSIGYSSVNRLNVNHEKFIVAEKVKECRNAQEMVEELDYCGIHSAVVYHQSAHDLDPGWGNRIITEESANHPDRLIPSWVILPPLSDQAFQPDRLLAEMKEHGVKLLRVYPYHHRFLLNAITMGETLDVMVSRRIPLYLSPKDGWEQIYQVLKEFPELTVILNYYGPWNPDRFLFPLLRAYPNVYLETGDYQTDGGLERTSSRFGSERLLFGSEFPTNYIGGPLATLIGSKLTPDEKENIAHKNIERIIGGVSL